MRSRLVASTHSALPDVTADQHHVQLHSAAHLPGATDALDNNLKRASWEPVGTGGINPIFTGSGAIIIQSAGRGLQINTGATNPSSCSCRVQFFPQGALTAQMNRVRRVEFQGVLAVALANTNAFWYVTDENTDTIPVATFRHLGIKALNGVVTFTTADGTTEQTTDISAFVVGNAELGLTITFDGATARCFINGTLRATHATNVPIAGGASPTAKLFINNNATVNAQTMAFFCVAIIVANS